MSERLGSVKIGLALVFLGLLFGISLGVAFGIGEGVFWSYIEKGIQAQPEIFDEKSAARIWRYAQRAHFHATGVAAFSFGLVILTAFSGLKPRLKSLSAVLIGLGGLYPLSWFAMFVLAPRIGTTSAHHHFLAEAFTYVGVGGLMLGLLLLAANMFFGLFADSSY